MITVDWRIRCYACGKFAKWQDVIAEIYFDERSLSHEAEHIHKKCKRASNSVG